MRLVQVRECDGKCCQESPRFPNEDHSDCKYHDPAKPEKGCKLMADPILIPEGKCPVMPNLSAAEAFIISCMLWPKHSKQAVGKTGGCCLQWVEDDS